MCQYKCLISRASARTSISDTQPLRVIVAPDYSLGDEMRTILPLLVCLAIPTAAAQSVNTCKVNGKTVITDKPCDRAMEATMEFGTPAERTQRRENCTSLAKSRAALLETMKEPTSVLIIDLLRNNVRMLDEQMAANRC